MGSESVIDNIDYMRLSKPVLMVITSVVGAWEQATTGSSNGTIWLRTG
jgi:hypothetical protein